MHRNSCALPTLWLLTALGHRERCHVPSGSSCGSVVSGEGIFKPNLTGVPAELPAARCGAPRSRSHSAAEVDHLGHPGAVVVAWQRGRPCSSDWPRSERRQRPSPHPRPRLRLATDGNESPRAGRRRRRRLLAENKGCLAPASNESPRAGHPRLVSAGRAIWARRPRVAHHLQCLALRAASASSCHLFLHGAK